MRARPRLTHEAARAAAASLLEALPALAEDAPFALRDVHELWLLDHVRGEPLALFAARLDIGADAAGRRLIQRKRPGSAMAAGPFP